MHGDNQSLTALLGASLLQEEAWLHIFPELPVQKDEHRKMLIIILFSYAAGQPYPVEQLEKEAQKQLRRSANTIKSYRHELVDLGLITTTQSPRGDARRRLIVPTCEGLHRFRALSEQFARIARLLVLKMQAFGPLPDLKAPEPNGTLEMLEGHALSLADDVFPLHLAEELKR